MLKFTTILKGNIALAARFHKFGSQMKNTSGAMKLLGIIAWRDVMDHFNKAEGPRGPWKDLKPATWAWKKKKGYTKMLQNTGALKGQTTWEPYADMAVVTAAAPYAVAQNSMRPFMWLSDDANKKIFARFYSYVTKE